ncbi:MAG: DinB family protein [Chloroflexi bacterium]|nr:DinB family protein [Chloroflexota bacterium]
MSATTTSAADLIGRFEAVNASLIALITSCPDLRWQAPCADDERSVAVVAHHTATVQQEFIPMVTTLAGGGTYTPASSMDEVHQSNAQHAHDHAANDKPATLALLQASGATIIQLLQGLDAAALGRTAGSFGGHALSVAQVVEYVVIGHAAEHLATLQATLAA